MPIDCQLWPMSILTKPVGEKDRKLIIHPQEAVLRSGIRKNENGELGIVDLKAIKIPSGTYHPEKKEQGHRHFLAIEPNGQVRVYGRRLNVQKTYSDIYPKLERSVLGKLWKAIPNETVLDFELCWPGHPDSEVTTAIKECPEELKPYFFSAPIVAVERMFYGDMMSYEEGREWLKKYVSAEYMTTNFKPITLTDANRTEVLEKLLRGCEKRKWEGVVLKFGFCNGWWKLKGLCEADVFVTGFKISEAETRMGLVTAVHIGVLDEFGKVVNMGNVSGFSLEAMTDMAARPKVYMGKVLRVVYQELAGQGKMKHGFFDGWRDDKNKDSCTTEQFQ